MDESLKGDVRRGRGLIRQIVDGLLSFVDLTTEMVAEYEVDRRVQTGEDLPSPSDEVE